VLRQRSPRNPFIVLRPRRRWRMAPSMLSGVAATSIKSAFSPPQHLHIGLRAFYNQAWQAYVIVAIGLHEYGACSWTLVCSWHIASPVMRQLPGNSGTCCLGARHYTGVRGQKNSAERLSGACAFSAVLQRRCLTPRRHAVSRCPSPCSCSIPHCAR
jgi:hypothetical protein